MRIMPPSGNRRTNRQRVGRHARILEPFLNASTYDRSRGNRIFVLRWLVAVDVVVANGKNRMCLSSRLIRGAVNPTKIFVRIRFTTSTEREKQSKRNRERERERGEAAILIKRRSTSFCATQFRRKERLGGCVYLNARFGGKRLSRWKRWRRRRRVNRGTSVAVVEMPLECRHCRKSERGESYWTRLGYLFSITRRKLLSPSSSLLHPPSRLTSLLKRKRKNNAAAAIRESRFNAFQFISYNKPAALSTYPFCRGDKLIAVSIIASKRVILARPVSIVSLYRLLKRFPARFRSSASRISDTNVG